MTKINDDIFELETMIELLDKQEKEQGYLRLADMITRSRLVRIVNRLKKIRGI